MAVRGEDRDRRPPALLDQPQDAFGDATAGVHDHHMPRAVDEQAARGAEQGRLEGPQEHPRSLVALLAVQCPAAA